MWTVSISSLALATIVVLDIVHRYLKSTRPRTPYPLPPGPSGLPLIGNLAAINPDFPWLLYAEWAKKYGDLIYTRLLGRDIIIINSEKIAKELLENRSRNYSDRPFLATKEMCGRDFSSIFLEYGDRWRLHRRFFHQTFRREAVHRFIPLQRRKACKLLHGFLNSPEQFPDHIYEYTGSITLNGVYAYETESRRDELYEIIANTFKVSVRALRPDISTLVGAFPAVLKLPSWFPGMSFKREMAAAKAGAKKYIEKSFEYSLQRLSTGYSAPSMVSDALRNGEEKGTSSNPEWMKDLSEAAATGFIAASETTDAVISLFLLLMAVTPEVQKKAQAQIDAVVGRNRLPAVEDRPLLPYIDAVIRETLRYQPVVPLSVPHAVLEDDVYAGYHIPKGAMVLSNLWSMSRNESKYPNPHEFFPERFLDDDGSLKPDDVENIAFGFGRRMCVGRHFADTALWCAIVNILAVFTIGKEKDVYGAEIPIELKLSNGVTIHPLPFQCSIAPRTPGMDAAQLERLIRAGTTA